MDLLKEELKEMGAAAKEHLERYPYSICDIRVAAEEMEAAKEIIADVVGAKLYKRINFLTKIED
jgi:SPX domain protein involved in polyphosphate accumulation